jgi:hypothetical protein
MWQKVAMPPESPLIATPGRPSAAGSAQTSTTPARPRVVHLGSARRARRRAGCGSFAAAAACRSRQASSGWHAAAPVESPPPPAPRLPTARQSSRAGATGQRRRAAIRDRRAAVPGERRHRLGAKDARALHALARAANSACHARTRATGRRRQAELTLDRRQAIDSVLSASRCRTRRRGNSVPETCCAS